MVQLLEQHSASRSNPAMQRNITATSSPVVVDSLAASASAAVAATAVQPNCSLEKSSAQHGAEAAAAAVTADAVPDHPHKHRATGSLTPSRPAAEFKVILVGDCGVGKSAWLNRQFTADSEFQKRYLRKPPPTTYHLASVTPPTLPPSCPHLPPATHAVDVRAVTVPSTRGDIVFNVWDISGKETVRVHSLPFSFLFPL
jgi:hypothetical protein